MPIPPRDGLWHVVDATRYSLGGLRRLLRETAARQELLGGAIGLIVLWLAGASGWQFGGFALLFLLLLAIEALNTAIEVLTNRVSPEYSTDAKHAKDLGSLAVGLLIIANVGFVASVLLG